MIPNPVETLRRDGIVGLDAMAGASEMLAFLKTRPTYHGHVKGASVARRQEGNSTCWAPEDILAAPSFFEYVQAQAPLAQEYLGPAARLYSVNVFTTYPIEGPLNPDIQQWHRDRDDATFLALFVYLTDVLTPDAGVHLYQMGTQTGMAHGSGVRDVLGPAGTAFVEDGRGIHMGVRPSHAPRTIAWARWGVSNPPPSYLWDKVSPVPKAVLGDRYPSDPVAQESIRLVVA